MALFFTKPGPQVNNDGAESDFRSDRQGSLLTADSRPRFAEGNLRNTLFSTGMTTTSIANVTFTTGTLGATCTPIVGIWNPLGSGKNCFILQVRLQGVVTAATATGGGAFVWCTNTNQSAISTGLAPLNRSTLLSTGAVAKGFANTALTGMVGNLVVQEAAGIFGGASSTYSEVGTAAGFITGLSGTCKDDIDGSIIVPPGGVLALLCTTTPVAISAASSLLWEEVTAGL